MMQRSRRRAAALAAAVALVAFGGCSRVVVSPIAPPPYRDETAAPYDATWRALARALAVENVPLRVVAKDSGAISSDDFISPIGVHTDCRRIGAPLLEGAARRVLHSRAEEASPEAIRREAHEVIARVKERVETELAAGG